jgi:RNA polymerase sigma-70 factor (ECF subfamily)
MESMTVAAVHQSSSADILVAALEARKNFSGKASEKTWLTGILKHKIMDLFRKKYRDAGLDAGDLYEREIHARFDHHGRWKTGPAETQRPAQRSRSILNRKLRIDPVSPATVPTRIRIIFMCMNLSRFSGYF